MEIVQKAPELVQPSPVRRPQEIARPQFGSARKQRLSPRLLSDERFIDPVAEAALILPQQAVSSPLVFEAQTSSKISQREPRPSLASALFEQITAWLSWLKTAFKGSRKERARLTKAGKTALEQLRYLSLLCDATEMRTPDEVLACESAFGEAYYEIMSLSANLTKMSEKEQDHHYRRYSKHMSSILQANE